MRFLLFALPLAATGRIFAQDNSAPAYWNTVNKLWCTGTRPDTSYSEFITKRCCSYIGGGLVFTPDGFCTGPEDSHGDGWFDNFGQCCGGHTALTHAYCINELCPSRSITIGGMSVAVNGTNFPRTTITTVTTSTTTASSTFTTSYTITSTSSAVATTTESYLPKPTTIATDDYPVKTTTATESYPVKTTAESYSVKISTTASDSYPAKTASSAKCGAKH